MMETILQLVVVFGAVAIGARYKGMGLGIFFIDSRRRFRNKTHFGSD